MAAIAGAKLAGAAKIIAVDIDESKLETAREFGATDIVEERGDEGIARVTLNRPAKRNALDLATIEELIDIFTTLPRAGVRAAILDAAGDHFCAGLDLVEHHREDRSAADFMQVCLRWHDAFNRMEYGGVPVIAVLQGAVVGGGLELASAAHIRVAGPGTYFGLPEGQRGLFTGGGATIRVADLIGKARMIDMMLSGRLYRGDEAVSVGLCLGRVCSEKQAWLQVHGLAGEVRWPMAGKPHRLYLDNATEFKSEALRRGCAQHAITLSKSMSSTTRPISNSSTSMESGESCEVIA